MPSNPPHPARCAAATSMACPQASSRLAQCPAPTPAISAQPNAPPSSAVEHLDGVRRKFRPESCRHSGPRAPPPPRRMPLTGMPSSAKSVNVSCERVSHALQHSAHKMRRRVNGGDAGKGRAHLGVKMRRALAQQVRRPFQALAARREPWPPPRSARRSRGWEKRSALSQLQAQTRRLRHAHHVPQSRNRVAEGVQAALGVLGRARPWRQKPRPKCRWWPKPNPAAECPCPPRRRPGRRRRPPRACPRPARSAPPRLR